MYNSLLIVIDYYFIINYDIHNHSLRERRKTHNNQHGKQIKIKQIKIK